MSAKSSASMCTRPKLHHAQPQGKNRRHAPAYQSDKIGKRRQQRQHQNRRHHPRRYQLAARVGTHRPHRVHLLGHQHGAKLRRNSRRASPSHQQTRQRRSQFAHQRQRHRITGQRSLPKAHKLRRGLQHHHCADKKSRQQHDRHRTHANLVHLIQRVLDIVRPGKYISNGLHCEEKIFLDTQHRLLERCQSIPQKRRRLAVPEARCSSPEEACLPRVPIPTKHCSVRGCG